MKPREPTAEELAAITARVGLRVASLNRVTFLAGHLVGEDLAGLVVLIEAALRERRVLARLEAARADAALRYLLPDDVW